MNIGRGLFRVWLVCAVLFVVGALGFMFSDLMQEFRRASFYHGSPSKDVIPLVPVRCDEARGVEWTDFNKLTPLAPHCWYELPKFRTHFPEYRDLSDKERSDRLYEEQGNKIEPLREPAPWALVLQTTSLAIGIPLAVLAIGAAFFWALAGFVSGRSSD